MPPVVPVPTADGARADVVFKVVEGPQTIVEHIFIIGNLAHQAGGHPARAAVQAGQPLGLEDLIESQRRLSALGLFRRIQISAISHGDPSLRDVLVTVEEARRRRSATAAVSRSTGVLRLSGTTTTARATSTNSRRAASSRSAGATWAGENRSVNLYTRLSLRPNSDPDRTPIASASPSTASSAPTGSRARSGATAT